MSLTEVIKESLKNKAQFMSLVGGSIVFFGMVYLAYEVIHINSLYVKGLLPLQSFERMRGEIRDDIIFAVDIVLGYFFLKNISLHNGKL